MNRLRYITFFQRIQIKTLVLVIATIFLYKQVEWSRNNNTKVAHKKRTKNNRFMKYPILPSQVEFM